MPVAIPELSPGSPLLQALPEFKSLENYGGATLEANIQAATTRFKLYNKAIDDVKAKVTALNNRPNELLGSDWKVSDDFSIDAEIPETEIDAFRAILKQSQNTELRDAYRKFLDLGPTGAIGGQSKNISRLIQFLRVDDPNVPVSDMVEIGLRKGIKFVPATNRNGVGSVVSSVGDIVIPFKNENGVIVPSVDLAGYRQALASLDNFRRENTFPRTLNPNKISLRIAATQAEFEADFNKISRTNRDLSGTQGVNFTLRPDGNEVTRSQDFDGTMVDKTSVIIINHEFSEKTPGEFGGENSIAETVLHEYGHSIHRALGIGWGDSSAPSPAYAEVRSQRVSSYGENNDQEHFAETFAKYMVTGLATPEFKSFLENDLGIKKLDITDVIPEWMQGNNPRAQYENKMAQTDLAGFNIEITRFTNPYQNYSANQLADLARRTLETGLYPEFTINVSGRVTDDAGRFAGEFTRTINRGSDGKVWIYHGTFFMQDDAQGGGFGTPFIEASFDLYREWGAAYVDVQAASTNGPYMWGLRGFDFKDKSARDARIKLAGDYYNVLSEYSSNVQEYGSIASSMEVSTKIANALAARGISMKGTVSIRKMVDELRQDGWIIDAELLESLQNISNMPAAGVTAKMLAELGREKRRTRDKDSSSVGRRIMMISGWFGRKIL